MPANTIPSVSKSKLKIRQLLTSLGILGITFGIFGWQLRAFNQRNADAQSAVDNITEEVPPANTHWHEATTEVRMGVAASIRGFLKSFQKNDSADALHFHTRAVRHQFTAPQEYMQLMRHNYPIIASNQRSKFRFVNMDKTHHFANAGLTIWDAEGRALETVYQLVFQDNQWRIFGIAKRPPQAIK
jgi:hypothetical protein